LTFLSPAGLFLLLGVPLLILLHLFRQERRRKEISSIFLWKEIQDQQSRRMRPHLLRNINLILQILAVIAAALALSRPVTQRAATVSSEELIVLVDTSASMLAREDGVQRIELATNRAREIIGRTRRDTRVMLVSAGPDPVVLQSYTTDRNLLYETMRGITATEGKGEIESALALARSVAFGASSQIVLVTDGAFLLPRDLVPPSNLEISLVGSARPNRGITAFELRSRPDGSAIEAYVEVANFADVESSALLELGVDSEIITQEEFDLGPGERSAMSLAIARRSGAVFHARLVGNDDDFPQDDEAFAVTAGSRPVRIQLVTEGNLFLESFLSVYPNIELVIRPVVDRNSPFDVLFLDNVPAPARLEGNVVALGTFLPDGPFTPEERVEPTQAVATQPDHPILREVHLEEARIRSAYVGALSPRATIVASSGSAPLIYVLRDTNLTLVGFTFAISDSDLPLRSGFPVLMHNIIEWMAPVAPGGEAGYNRVGLPIDLYVPVGEAVTVTRPDGTSITATPRSSPYRFNEATGSGIYTVEGESFSDRFAVSLASIEESNLTPRLQLGTEDSAQIAGDAQSTGTPIWHWLALAALLCLVAEWIVWARRT
jgi:Ca-activated chloride channel family protein